MRQMERLSMWVWYGKEEHHRGVLGGVLCVLKCVDVGVRMGVVGGAGRGASVHACAYARPRIRAACPPPPAPASRHPYVPTLPGHMEATSWGAHPHMHFGVAHGHDHHTCSHAKALHTVSIWLLLYALTSCAIGLAVHMHRMASHAIHRRSAVVLRAI